MKRILITLLAAAGMCGTVVAGEHDILKIGPVLVAETKENCEKVMELVHENDRDAAMAMIQDGTAFFLPKGTVIVVEDIGWGYDRIHLKGDYHTLWISNHILAQFYNSPQ
jgi:hypothetical protein